MPRPIRVAVLGWWHVHAKDYTAAAERHPDVELAAIWDDEPARGAPEAERRGVPFVPRLDDVLGDRSIDGVIVTTATTAHAAVIPAAAAAGKPIFSEKVIAPTLRETEAIIAAVERAGVAFVVSLPRLSAGYTQAISDALAAGRVGTPTFARVRISHDGALPAPGAPAGWLPARFYDPATAAGGALIDLGAHPLYLVRRFLGLPERVSATYGHATGRAVEDNAGVAFGYPSGAIGQAEVSFVGAAHRFAIEVHGTSGSLLYGEPDEQLRYRPVPVRGAPPAEWSVLELPPDRPSAFEQWVTHIQTGSRATENVALARDLSALAEAANRSAAGGRVVRLADLAGDGGGQRS